MTEDPKNSLADYQGLGRNIFILLFWLLLLNFFVFRGDGTPVVAYSDFLQEVKADHIAEVKFTGNRLEY